eukprot:m.87623 g.87623  ORF g.87623 m.87623 type:complete len:269 (+) comp36546_c0_seq1:704-1510(+)
MPPGGRTPVLSGNVRNPCRSFQVACSSEVGSLSRSFLPPHTWPIFLPSALRGWDATWIRSEDLAKQTLLQYGGPPWIASDLLRSHSAVLHSLGKYMLAHPEGHYGADDGVNEVKTNSSFAYVNNYWQLRYYASLEPCNTRVVARTVVGRFFSLAMPKNMSYEETINSHLLDMIHEGMMEHYERKWFDYGPCTGHDVATKSRQYGAQTLGMKEMGGIFILLLITIFLAFLVAFLEKMFVKGAGPAAGEKDANPLYEVKSCSETALSAQQ